MPCKTKSQLFGLLEVLLTVMSSLVSAGAITEWRAELWWGRPGWEPVRAESPTHCLIFCGVSAQISSKTVEKRLTLQAALYESLYIKKPAGFKITGQTKPLYLAKQTKGQNTFKPEKWVCTYFYQCNDPQVLSNTRRSTSTSNLHSACLPLERIHFYNEVKIISDIAAAPQHFS